MYLSGRGMESMTVQDKSIAHTQRVSALNSHVYGLEGLRNTTNNPLQRTQSVSSEDAEEELFRAMSYPTRGRESIKIFHKVRNITTICLIIAVIIMAVVIGITVYYKIYPGRDSSSINASPINTPPRNSIKYNLPGKYSIRPENI